MTSDERSPREYGDQYALFDAEDPCTVIEHALASAGRIAPQRNLSDLGLFYVGGCSFRAEFLEQKRIVVVSVARRDHGLCRLTVRCYRIAEADCDIGVRRLPVRGHHPDGTPISDPLAASLSYDVACLVHGALVRVASNLRWAAHADPEPGNEHREPVAPVPA
jgi:hypothetical protein